MVYHIRYNTSDFVTNGVYYYALQISTNTPELSYILRICVVQNILIERIILIFVLGNI